MEYAMVSLSDNGVVIWINDHYPAQGITLTTLGKAGFRFTTIFPQPNAQYAPILIMERDAYSEIAQHNPVEQFYFTPRKEEHDNAE